MIDSFGRSSTVSWTRRVSRMWTRHEFDEHHRYPQVIHRADDTGMLKRSPPPMRPLGCPLRAQRGVRVRLSVAATRRGSTGFVTIEPTFDETGRARAKAFTRSHPAAIRRQRTGAMRREVRPADRCGRSYARIRTQMFKSSANRT